MPRLEPTTFDTVLNFEIDLRYSLPAQLEIIGVQTRERIKSIGCLGAYNYNLRMISHAIRRGKRLLSYRLTSEELEKK
jgi:hypothetical protein